MILGPGPRIICLEIVFDDAREGDAEHTHADVSKATDLLDD